MDISISINIISISLFAAIVFTGFLRTLARRYEVLIDLPDQHRKFHSRPTPLVGGLGIHFAMLFGLAILFISVDTKIYDRNDRLQSLKSSIKVSNEAEIEAFNVNATKKNNGIDAKSNVFEVSIKGEPYPLTIKKNSDGNFELLLSNGNHRVFSYENGILKDLDLNKDLNINQPDESLYFSINVMMLAIVCFGIIFQAFMLIDDTRGLRPATRLIIQSLASLGVIVTSGNYITNIGFEVLGWNGNLGYLGIFFTIFAVTGIINAFNMIDGINGLCSGVALVTFLFLAYLSGNTAMTYGSLIIISSLVGFLIYNLGLFGKNRAVFLGDNGSNFIGFLVGWSCINYSSDEIMLMNPTTALWLVAIPLWDCVTLIFKRLIAGSSALSGDRMHIHHILCDVGFSENKALVILLLGSLFLAITGVTIERIFDPVYSVILFISLGLTFVLCKSKFVSMAYSHK